MRKLGGACLHLVREAAPRSWAEPQRRPGTILDVTHDNYARERADQPVQHRLIQTTVTSGGSARSKIACRSGLPAAFSAGRSRITCVPVLPLMRVRWRYGRGGTRIPAAWSIVQAAVSGMRLSVIPGRLVGEQAVRPAGSKGDSYDNAAAEALNSPCKWYDEDRIRSYSSDMPPRKYEEIYYQALDTAKLMSSSQI